MHLRNVLKICGIGLAVLVVQACASAPDAQPQKTDNHIKTEVPPPFPITSESLRKEREVEANKKAAQ